LARMDREIRAIIDAIKAGFRTASMQSELLTLEGDRGKLLKTIKAKQPKLVRLHPDLDQVYRNRLAKLEENSTRSQYGSKRLRFFGVSSRKFDSFRRKASFKSSSSATSPQYWRFQMKAPAKQARQGR